MKKILKQCALIALFCAIGFLEMFYFLVIFLVIPAMFIYFLTKFLPS